MQAAIAGLQAIRLPLSIHIYTVSNYLKDGSTVWVEKWSKNSWRTKDDRPVKDRDLWQKLARLTKAFTVTWHLIKKNEMPCEMHISKQLSREAVQVG